MAVASLKDQLLGRRDIEQLAIFRRQYLQRIRVSDIDFPPGGVLKVYAVQEWIWSFVAEAQREQRNSSYDRIFLKILLAKVERAVEHTDEPDIVDAFANFYSELLLVSSTEGERNEGYFWIQYVSPTNQLDPSVPEDGLSVLEKPNVLSATGSTGHRTWEAAIHFGQWLVTGSAGSMIQNKRVLELGAGTGLLSLLAAKQGAESVVATDLDERSLLRLREAAERNNLEVTCKHHAWGDPVASLGPAFDTVIGADVTYDPAAFPSLISTLKQVLELSPNAVIWICATVRNADTLECFKSGCEREGFRLTVFPELAGGARDQKGFFLPHTTALEVMTLTKDESKRPARYVLRDSDTLLSLGRDWPF